jgi:hypothetical protein
MGKRKSRAFLLESLCFLILILLITLILVSQEVSAAAGQGQEEGALFYGVGTSLHMRELNSSTLWTVNRSVFSASGAINWTRVRSHPFNYEYAVLFTNSSGAVFLGFLNENNKSVLTNVSIVTTWGAGTNFRFADIEYERVSGNLIVVYSNGSASPQYRIRYNSNKSLSSQMSISVARTSAIIEWVGLVQHPFNNEIAFAYSDATDDLNALKWNGSAWTSEPASILEANLPATDFKGFGIAYEQKSGDILLMWGRAAVADLYYSISLNGSTTWSAAAARTQFAEIGDFVDLGADPTSNFICIQEKDEAADDIHNGIWNGTGFLAVGNNDASSYSATPPAITLDCAWLGDSRRAVSLYSDVVAGNTVVDWASYAVSTNTWTVQTDWTPNPAMGSDLNIRGFSFPNSSLNKSLFIIGDINSDLWAKTVSYSAAFSWANTEGGSALETSLSSRNSKCWDFTFSNAKAFINTAPNVNLSNITSSESNFYANATLIGSCNATDFNGDNLTYSYVWYLNGAVNSTGSLYSRAITITNTGSALSNYQVKVVLNSSFNYSKCAPDGSDISFLNSSKTGTFYHWIESWNTSGNSIIWVNVTSVAGSAVTTMYMYYGEKGNSGRNSGNSTFDFFDDFSGGLGKWTIDENNTDAITIYSSAGNPSPSLRHDPDSTQYRNAYYDTRMMTQDYQITDGIISYDLYVSGTSRAIHQFGYRVDSLEFGSGYAWRLQSTSADGGFFNFNSGAWSAFGAAYPAVSFGTWYSVQVNVSGSNYNASVNPGSSVSASNSSKISAGKLVSHIHATATDYYVLLDNVKVRKYASPEPSVVFSDEEAREFSEGTFVNIANISSGLSVGQNWTLECTANDGTDSSSQKNSTKITIVASNSPPNITSIFVDDGTFAPAGEIDLSPGDIKVVLCNGTADDPDGFSDISAVSAVFYASGNGTLPTYPEDNNTLYKNSSCTLSAGYSTTKKNFNCSFSLFYYAQNGTWTCNATVNDTKSENASAITSSTVNNLIAFNISSLEINYGNLAPGGASASSVVYYITNFGNTRIDLSLNGTNMSCASGFIIATAQHYNVTGTDQAYAQMRALPFSSFLASDFDLDKKITADSNRTTYWRIQVPVGVKGKCTGNISLSAQLG